MLVSIGGGALIALLLAVSILAIWPVVADAPWEDSAPAPVVDRTDEIRCEGALGLRQAATTAIGSLQPAEPFSGSGIASFGGIDRVQLKALQDQLAQAEREISRYC